MIYLSPAPLYHSAPQAAVNLTIKMGGTVIVMENFDPERYLELVEKWGVTHSQLVPTMFSRMLKLPEAVRKRYDLSSLEIAVHAAAPCPAAVKDDMIKWWGPIIHEYYGATEGLGFTACSSAEWLAHRGTVGRVLLGELHILDEDMKPCPVGTPGTIWFRTATPFEYFNDPNKTREARSPDGSMSTVGDVGYVDSDGFLHLTDRATFMIISGGVNIYPQECENLLITHPKIADAAVFGVPNADLGEEVKAVVQPMPGILPGPDLAEELIFFCSQSLSRQKVPRSIDFENELPRLPTGKLYKRLLRDRYLGRQDVTNFVKARVFARADTREIPRRDGNNPCRCSTRTLLPRCKPDDMAGTAALGGGAHGNLVHGEAGFAKPFGKQGMRPRRPNRQHAAGPQCPADGFQPLQIVERIVGFADQTLGAIVDIEQDRIKRRRMGLNHLDDVCGENACAGIGKAIAEDVSHWTLRPRDHGGHKLGHHDPGSGSQHGERGAECEPHAQSADQ
jgi:hypothetical protein